MDDTLAGLFDIPEQHYEDQIVESCTLGGESYETGKTDNTGDVWDPLAGF